MDDLSDTSDIIYPFDKEKQISVFLRCYNEEEFLRASVESIIEHVDEVVIIDSDSTDSTGDIITELVEEHESKIKPYNYSYKISKVGMDNLNTYIQDKDSPNLLSNFYNWCLNKCKYVYTLKWDADMVATKTFGTAIDNFKKHSNLHLLTMRGYNIHPDWDCLVSAASEEFSMFTVAGVPFQASNYIDGYTSKEKRLFPKTLYSYVTGHWWCESLHSPFEHKLEEELISLPCYVHLKLCKRSVGYNMSDQLMDAIKENFVRGLPLTKDIIEVIEKYNLTGQEEL